VKNKYVVEYTRFLSLLCPWRLDWQWDGQAELKVSTGGPFSGSKKKIKSLFVCLNVLSVVSTYLCECVTEDVEIGSYVFW
jgi:hypothetical protein